MSLLSYLHFKNDLIHPKESIILKKIDQNSRFSATFILLLISSSIVCSLGLLINNATVIIGGMIISPIMWSLTKISIGISSQKISYLRQGLALFLFSTALALISSMVITSLSPIKTISDEILSRTNPTLLDLIIALIAGVIAALAITQPKVSETLAGVAIATSLMSPLCVSGIGLSLWNLSVFTGGILLYLANVISIILVSIIIFILIGVKHTSRRFPFKKTLALLAFLFIAIAIPLYLFLQSYSYKVSAYNQVQTIIQNQFKSISKSIYPKNIKTNLTGNLVTVDAEVLIPQDFNINYQHQQDIIYALKKALNKEVSLNLQLQKTLSIQDLEDITQSKTRQHIKDLFVSQIDQINPSLAIDSLDVVFYQNDIALNSVLRGDPNIPFTYSQQEQIQNILKQAIGQPISLNLEIISRVKIQSRPEMETEQIKQETKKWFQSLSDSFDIQSVAIRLLAPADSTSLGSALISLEIKKPKHLSIDSGQIDRIKSILQNKFKRLIILEITTIDTQMVRF